MRGQPVGEQTTPHHSHQERSHRDALHCIKNEVISPIDQLAKEGTVSSTAFHSCAPARSGLLTDFPASVDVGLREAAGRYSTNARCCMIGYYTFDRQDALVSAKIPSRFRATLVDESGRVETPDFVSDYRNGFNCTPR